jgi:hypothetical protein
VIARALAAGLVLALASCGGAKPSAAGASAECTLLGTVLDAATREPVAGARIDAAGAGTAVSSDDGRFAIRDLPFGTEGLVTAAAPDSLGAPETPGNRRGSVTLRPLREPTLEIVLHLAAD